MFFEFRKWVEHIKRVVLCMLCESASWFGISFSIAICVVFYLVVVYMKVIKRLRWGHCFFFFGYEMSSWRAFDDNVYPLCTL